MDGMTENSTRADLTRVLAGKASALGFDELPVPVRELARQCVLDYLGVALAGAQDPLVRILFDETAEAAPRQSPRRDSRGRIAGRVRAPARAACRRLRRSPSRREPESDRSLCDPLFRPSSSSELVDRL